MFASPLKIESIASLISLSSLRTTLCVSSKSNSSNLSRLYIWYMNPFSSITSVFVRAITSFTRFRVFFKALVGSLFLLVFPPPSEITTDISKVWSSNCWIEASYRLLAFILCSSAMTFSLALHTAAYSSSHLKIKPNLKCSRITIRPSVVVDSSLISLGENFDLWIPFFISSSADIAEWEPPSSLVVASVLQQPRNRAIKASMIIINIMT